MWTIVAILVILALLFGLEGMRNIVGGIFALIIILVVAAVVIFIIYCISPEKKDGKKDFSWLFVVAIFGAILLYAAINNNGSNSNTITGEKTYQYLYAYFYDTAPTDGSPGHTVILDGGLTLQSCQSKKMDYVWAYNHHCGYKCNSPGFTEGYFLPTCEQIYDM